MDKEALWYNNCVSDGMQQSLGCFDALHSCLYHLQNDMLTYRSSKYTCYLKLPEI